LVISNYFDHRKMVVHENRFHTMPGLKKWVTVEKSDVK